DVDAADVARLDHAQAVQILLDHYFTRPRLGDLPGPLQATVFDMYVNAGTTAVKL
ncbi:MAG TPA: peptidoglycan-binding protein, partial [Citreicella sp.]|nr:peptidoglycan-binding protein [Citreicella sp.]